MKRYEMIKDKKYFNRIIKSGKYIKDKYFVIYYINKDNNQNDFPHFGIAIKNSIGSAVVRNRLKRQTRSIIDANKKLFKNDRDYIIMIRNESLNSDFQKRNDSFLKLMKGNNK